MEFVASVRPVHHIGQGRRWECRIPLDEQKRCLMSILDECRFGGVTLAENDMPADTKTGLFPGCEKQIHLRAAVKADRHAVVSKNAVHLGECWPKPRGIVVVEDLLILAA